MDSKLPLKLQLDATLTAFRVISPLLHYIGLWDFSSYFSFFQKLAFMASEL
jgi:hypothetical protein